MAARGARVRAWNTALAVFAAFALRLAFDRYLAPPFILFYPAIVFIAWTEGMPAGVGATMLSAALAVAFLLPGAGEGLAAELTGLAVFVAMGCLISVGASRVRAAARRKLLTERDAAARRAAELLEAHEAQLEQAQAAARRDHAQLAAVLASMGDAIIVFDRTGEIVLANQTPDGAPGFPGSRRGYQDLRALARDYELSRLGGPTLTLEQWPASRVLRGETVEEERLRMFHRPTGEARVFRFSGRPVLGERGEVRLAMLVARDLTGALRAGERLRESEERARAIFERAAVGMAETDAITGRFLRVNRAYCELLGRSREELLELSWRDVTYAEDFGRALVAQVDATGRGQQEKRYLRKDGSVVWVSLNVSSLDPSDPRAPRLAIAEDITARKQAETALREREQRLQVIHRVSLAGHLTSRRIDGRILEVSDAWLEQTGFSRAEALGSTTEALRLYLDPAQRETLLGQATASGRSGPHEVRIRRKDGALRHMLITAAAGVVDGEACFIGAWHDVTEMRELEEQYRQAQKLESVGRLAGGVAHDFNNILCVILSYAEAMKMDLAERTPIDSDDLEQVLSAGKRARDLTRQLLTFARKQPIEPQVLQLGAVVRGSEKLLRRVLGEDIELSVCTADGLWPTFGDTGQLEQVLMNLAVNARDAMPGGGRLSVSTENFAAPGGAEGHPAGEWVCLRVGDTGTGMSAEVKAHLFEPFFTTKAAGCGTGLGLATVHGIVAQAGGHIHVESAPGQGTVFELCLPRCEAGAAPAAEEAEAARSSGSETVLLVEDDAQLRAVLERALRRAGYRVLVAESPLLARELPDRELAACDLLLTDMVMPGLSGCALSAALRLREPSLRTLFMSGYVSDLADRRALDGGGERFIAKPFTPHALLERVRQTLDEPRALAA